MKKKRAQKSRFSIMGYLLFFVLISFVASVAILAYSFILSKSGGNQTATALWTLGVLLVLTLICTVIDVLRRKYTVEKPVEKIIDATERITSGDFTVQLKPTHLYGRFDEFDVIMENINRMTAELSKNEVLKTDFIANVSHEIKTPLSLIQNCAVALSGENLSPAARKEYADTLTMAAKRLSDLLTNILKLNKLENQEIYPDKKKFDLSEQLRQCILSFDEKLEAKKLDLQCEIEEAQIVSDEGLLEIIWNNLLSNAVKFTDEGGAVSVSLQDRAGFVQVTVRDTGCGIEQESGKKIFEKFFQADASRATEGNGLGLTLVKRVIDILGGEILVESQVGKGSAFTIKLKKEKV